MVAEQKTEHVITGEIIIADLVERYPQLVDILTQNGIHCVGCHVSPYETLEQGALGHGMPQEAFDNMLEQLNEAVKNAKPQEKSRKPASQEVTVTDSAASKAKEFSDKENKKGYGLRIRVVPGGCSGFSYELTFDKKAADDKVIEKNGVKVFIDPDSMMFLGGAKIDYVETLNGAGFKIDNPNAKSSCGCGNSFG